MQLTAHRILSAPERAVYVVLDGEGFRSRVEVALTPWGPATDVSSQLVAATKRFARGDVESPDLEAYAQLYAMIGKAVRKQVSIDAIDDFNRERRA